MSESGHADHAFGILGPLEVTVGGARVDLGGPKQRAVLALLLIDANRVVSLDRLVDQLWGGEPPPSATGSLQAYVSNLRRVLEPDRHPGTAPRVLVTKPPGYSLSVAPDHIDATVFERLLTGARGDLNAGRPSAALRALDEGLALWRGPALAEFAFEPFARAECARLEELRWSAMESQIEARVALGEHLAAVAQIESMLETQPLRERLWSLLMLALYRAGRQGDALDAFRRARETLAEQLGIDPSPELQSMEQDILHQSPSLDWQPPREAPGPAVSIATRRASGDRTAGAGDPFVGRDAHLRQLTEVAVGLGARVALVLGEPGIGKTRLVREATRPAEESGALVAWGRCHEGEGAPAFWPWLQIIRAVAGAETDLPADVATLTDLVPGAESASPTDPQQVLRDAMARSALYDGVTRMLISHARSQPTVLVLDDIQWADTGSLQLLEFLSQQLTTEPLTIVATYRDTEVGEDHPLVASLGVLARAGAVQIKLVGLDRAAVGELVSSSAPAPDVVVEAVHARTGGNPFFVRELVRLIASEGGAERADELLRIGLPLGVRDVVRRRLARLPGSALPILSVAAVEGREFDFAMLEATEGIDPEVLLTVLEAALITNLVEESTPGTGMYRFAHDLVRETLLERLSAPRRARLHALIAEAAVRIGAHRDPERARRVAAHFWHGAAVVGAERALPFVVSAADIALAHLAYETEVLLLQRSVALLARLPDQPKDREFMLQLRLGNALARVEGYGSPGAGAAFERALALSDGLDAAMTISAMWGLWTFTCVRAEFHRARDLAVQILERAKAIGHAAFTAIGHECAGIIAWHLGEVEHAIAHLTDAVDHADRPTGAAEAPTLQDTRVSSRVFMCAALLAADRFDDARTQIDEALKLAEGDPYSTSFALAFDMWSAMYSGDRARGRERADLLIATAQSSGFRMWETLGAVGRGWADDDPRRVRDAIDAFVAGGSLMLGTFLNTLLAEAAQRSGAEDDARAAISAAYEAMDRTGERFFASQMARVGREIGFDPSERAAQSSSE